MKAFLSWSGTRSRQVAHALRPWLRTVLPDLAIWMSEEDLRPGDRWSVSLRTELSHSDVGIVCLTPENIESPWLFFEAGAISNKDQSAVVPLLIDLLPEDLPAPLQEFQAATADKKGLFRLCRLLNSRKPGETIDEVTMTERFSISFPAIEPILASGAEAGRSPGRTKKRLLSLDEFLQGLKTISKGLSERQFHADVAIGCGRSGSVLAGILATNLGIRHVVALDRIVAATEDRELHYQFGGLVSLREGPSPRPKVLLCSMLAETGETIDLTRRVLKSCGWPSNPGEGFEVVTLFSSESVRLRKPYVIVGVEGYRGVEALQNLPYMFAPYDFLGAEGPGNT